MSALRRGDQELHYSDNSHRWVAPPEVDQCDWNAALRAHLDRHLATMGGPADATGGRSCRVTKSRGTSRGRREVAPTRLPRDVGARVKIQLRQDV